MGDIKRKATFEKIFREAVPNSEGKIWFKHPSKMYCERKVCFMLDGKETFVPIYMNVSSIEQWKEHFIEYVETGNFDMNFYCQVYGDNIPYSVASEIHKFPLTELGSNKFYCHHKGAMKMLQAVRDKYGDAGLKVVPKPKQDYTKKNTPVGYQVVDKDNDIHPDMDASFCIYSLEDALDMFKDDKVRWRLLPIYDGDIEEPTLMF